MNIYFRLNNSTNWWKTISQPYEENGKMWVLAVSCSDVIKPFHLSVITNEDGISIPRNLRTEVTMKKVF